MNVTINGQAVEKPENTCITDIAREYGIENGGGAVAVNKSVIRRSAWSETVLKEGDQITVIKAAYGG